MQLKTQSIKPPIRSGSININTIFTNLRLSIVLLVSAVGLSGCYAINEKHYNDIINIEANFARLKAADEKLAQRIATLQPFEQALKAEFAPELQQHSASIQHPSASTVGMAMQGPLLFSSGSTELSNSGRALLTRLAVALKKAPDEAIIRVIGHADQLPLRGTLKTNYLDNWGLSSARAAAVARILVWGKKINTNKIYVEGRSFYDPININEANIKKANNRRVEVFVELMER